MKRLLLSALVLVLGSVSAVQADMISGPFTTTTPIPYTTTDWTGSLSFPMFNSALGTLIQVDIALSGAMQTTLTVQNAPDAGGASSGWAKTELQMSVQDPGANFAPPQIDMYSPQFNFTSLAPGDTVVSGLLTKSATGSEISTLAAVLAEFNGPGTIVLPASTYTQSVISYNGGNANAQQATSGSLTGTVTYHYIPTPEPGTLVLLGVAGIGLLGYLGRRRS
jgi:hypothetical protein